MATLLMKEYYSPGTIVLAGLTTRSGNELLQTGGMVWFRIVQNGDTMSAETKKTIEIRMPVTNKELTNMGVFAMHNRLDSAGWNSMNKSFRNIDGYWDWPTGSAKTFGAMSRDYRDYVPSYRFENWIVGGKDEDEYNVTTPAIILWPGIRLINISRIKKVKRLITKVDSVTLSVKAHITYRARGVRAFGTKYYDTTFDVKYMRGAYAANISSLNWLNCDRFLYAKNKTNLHIKTANCEGAGIMLYFKKLQAYMPAYSYRNVYEVNNIPEDEDVSIIAFGKQGDGFYFTNKECKVGKNSTVTVNLEKVTKEEFKRKIMRL